MVDVCACLEISIKGYIYDIPLPFDHPFVFPAVFQPAVVPPAEVHPPTVPPAVVPPAVVPPHTHPQVLFVPHGTGAVA